MLWPAWKEANGAALEGLGSPDKAQGLQLYLEFTFMDPDVRTPIPIITFEVLGEQNCIFIEKSKRGPFLPLPLVIYFSEMDSFVFVQIASLCLSDQKDVSLYLTFHITTLMWAGGQQS